MGKRDKYIDWLTTFILFLIPVILTYQESIIQFVPKEYLYIVSGIFAILSQIGTEGRVQSVKEKYKQIENWTVNDILVLETLKSKQIITQTQFDEKKDELLGL
ncbi:MAG: hypothetical protein A4E27_01594 [Methanobacterium sp. PtaU1.Bin242]|nr:MAG: hypothetical protein A4E27_01594 [Methanobacterium sp. PtaU1.Bin242]